MRYLWLVPSIFLIHFFFGRLVSIPYALAIFHKWYWAVFATWPIDIITVPFWLRIFDKVTGSRNFVAREKLFIRYLRREIEKFTKKKIFRRERKLHSRILRRAQRWGQFGVILVAALPFVGGGIWSGVLLARFLRLKVTRGYLLICLGSALGASFISLGIHGIKELILKLFA
ncbi:MAG: small multi-drug export protein [bacterium]